MLEGENRRHFEELDKEGHAAKDRGDHYKALVTFKAMDTLAAGHDDHLARMHSLTPAARALWSMERFDEAEATLGFVADIAASQEIIDEQGITVSNIGRIAAVKTVKTVPINHQAAALRREAVPKFKQAYAMLKGHPHLYYRFANAQHGAVVSAMAGDRRTARTLIGEGARVAFRRSDGYDRERTYDISSGTRRGLLQLAAATALIPFGDRTPFLAKFARRKLIR